jgi:hypothetical protein
MKNNNCPIDTHKKQPLIMMTLEPFDPIKPVVGYYDEENDTWSIRDWQSVNASPRKHNREH